MYRPIAPGLSPNVALQDAILALQHLFFLSSYKKGNAIAQLENFFKEYFSTKFAISFASGRGALTAILQLVDLQKGDEVLVQAFTCRAVIDAILWAGLTPVYVDITDAFVMDEKDIEKKMTKKTKVILVQHTFGISGISDSLLQMVRKHKLLLIEDAAHTIGATYKNKKLGTFGDAAIFSLGRDKALSSVSGGIAITNNVQLAKKIHAFQKEQEFPTSFWIFQQLFHPVVFYFCIMPLYDFLGMGKLILVILQKFHLLSFPVEKESKKETYIKRLPNALASLANKQLERVDEYNAKRKMIGAYYEKHIPLLSANILYKNTPLLRYPLFVEDPKELKKYLRKNTIYMGDWYSNIIDPKGTPLEAVLYKKGSCPKAEYAAAHISNLPVYPTMGKKDMEKVAMIVKQYDTNKANHK